MRQVRVVFYPCTSCVFYSKKSNNIQSGFLGHQNDAQHFRLMPQIGHNQELDFPQNVVLLADKIYPNGYPLMTPYTRRQLNARPDNVRRKYSSHHGPY
jgi:hypothetical protein